MSAGTVNPLAPLDALKRTYSSEESIQKAGKDAETEFYVVVKEVGTVFGRLSEEEQDRVADTLSELQGRIHLTLESVPTPRQELIAGFGILSNSLKGGVDQAFKTFKAANPESTKTKEQWLEEIAQNFLILVSKVPDTETTEHPYSLLQIHQMERASLHILQSFAAQATINGYHRV